MFPACVWGWPHHQPSDVTIMCADTPPPGDDVSLCRWLACSPWARPAITAGATAVLTRYRNNRPPCYSSSNSGW